MAGRKGEGRPAGRLRGRAGIAALAGRPRLLSSSSSSFFSGGFWCCPGPPGTPRPPLALPPGGRMGEQAPAAGQEGAGFALDREFLRSPKGLLMGAELGLCFLVFLLLTASVSAYMGAALLEMLVTLTFLGLRATFYHERLTRVNWPCLDFLRSVSAAIIFIVVGFAVIATNHEGSAVSAFVFSLILIGIFCLDAYKTYQAEMGSEEDPERR